MKTKNYSKDVSFGGNNIIIIFFLLMSVVMHSQVRVNFTPREPIASPSTSIFNIKGDFTLIGNTNLTLNNYDVNEPNSNNNMIYVDIDGDSNTFNSSSANLTFSTENGAVPECSKVVFAGLYWTGRSSDGSNSPDIFNVTKNSVTKTFNKRKVKLKGPTSSSYTEITANTNDIYYPQNSDGFMYSAFAEITEYVKANGIGQYTVADIALVEGNGGSTGYYGGWGIIVVYENSKMKWRDITVFDGHAYVQGNSTLSHQIPISGFNAVQTGQVNVKLGLMAGEGDRSISGDYFNIQRSSDNNWQTLSHSGNSTNNFFNSSIQTGGNTRNPNLVNNTGLDISMFNIPNPSNSVIANNQTSATLRYGSTQDTYVIFMAAMAVDAYIPDPEGVMSLVTINGVPATSTTTVTPGQEIEYSIKILNEGTENINNAQIKIQLPYTATFVNGSQNGVINFSPLPTPNNIYFNPNDGPSGTLIWDIGTLPVPATPTTVLGELKYKIKITEDCFLLKNPNCVPSASLFGYINGIGAITGIQIINKPFIQGYVTSGLCIGDPILNPITTMIDATNFINQNCQNTITELVFNYCSPISQVPFNSIASNYPIGTQFYNSYPVNGSTIEYTNSNPFPNTLGSFNYYAVPPNANGCYYTLKINIVGSPTITSPQAVNILSCSTNTITELPISTTPVSITLQDFINIGGSVSNNSLSYTISYVDVITGSCPTVINRSYTLTTLCVTTNLTQVFTIERPDFTLPANTSSTVACAADIVAPSVPVVTDNCGNVLVASAPSISANPTCEGNVTYTYTFTDCEGNTHNWIHTFTIEHSDFTLPANTTSTVACAADIVAPSVPVVTDNCGNVLVASAPSISASPTCEGNVTYTYTFTDCEGNTHNWIHTFTIEHSDFTLPANTTSTVACAADIVAPSVPVVTDNCGNVLVASAPSISANPTCEGNVTYTYTFTDCEGNTHNWIHTFTIEHSDFTLPANTSSTVACAADIVAPSVPVVTDNCGNVLVASAPSISANPTCEGNVTYTYTFTDCEGNTHNWIHTFTIEHSDFTLPANTSSTVACAADIVAPSVPVVTDNCGNVLVASAPSISASPTCEGNVTYTYTFTDCEGNTHNWIHTFTIEHSDFTLPANTSSTVACAADIVAPSVPVVTDNCGNVLVASAPSISANPTCEGNVTYTYTFTDCEGNTHNWIHTFTIEHSDFTLPANTSSTVACAADIVAPSVPVVTDNCGNVLVASAPSISASPTCEGNVTYTYTFTDCEGNTHNWIHTFTIEHSDFTLPANTSSTVACAADIVAPSVPVVTDNCGNVLVASAPSISASPTCEGNVTYTYTFTDCEGNTHNWIHTFTIEHSDFTLPANTTSTVACAADIVAPSVPVVTDNCGNVLVASAPSISANPTCEGNVTYTYTFTDCEGNTHNWIHTFTIEHSDFTLPANTTSTVACAADIVAPSVPVVTDNCGNVLVASAPSISASPTCEGNVTYTYTFTDCEGNTHNWIHTFTIEHSDFTLPANTSSTVACAADIVAPSVPVVTDNCGNVLVASAPSISASPTCEGNVTYTYTFTDCEGNTHNWIHTFTIEHSDFTLPANTSSTVACAADIVAPSVPVVTDNCGNVLVASAPSISASPTCEGNVTYTYTFTDCEGNTHNWIHTFTIEHSDFTLPANTTSTVACAADIVAPSVPVVTDNCGNVLVASAPSISASPTCEGNVTYTYTFTDCEGNTHNWIHTFTIEHSDFTLPANTSSTVACAADIVAPSVPVVTDNCGNVLVASAPSISANPTCEGNVTYTYTFTDCEGNTHNWIHTFTIEHSDFTLPANTSSTVACAADIVAPSVPVVTDNCGNVLVASAPSISANPTCEGNVTYTYTFTDCEGNTHNWIHTFTIEHSDFTLPANTSSTVACAADIVAPSVPVVTDNCGNVLVASAPSISANPTCEGNVTYTYTFTDCEGNTHNWIHTFTIEHSDFTLPANTSSTVACAADIVAPSVPVVTDNCGNVLVASAPSISANPTCEGNVTYTYTFTDCEGNTHNWIHTFTIDDTSPPTGIAPSDILDLQCTSEIPVADINLVTDVADNCNGTVTVTVSETNNEGSGCNGNPLIITRTYTLTDCSGLTTNLIQTIRVEDNTAPIFTSELPQDISVSCDAIPNPAEMTGSDNCSDVTITVLDTIDREESQCEGEYIIRRTWTITDSCNNSSSYTQTITVFDNTPPILSTPLDTEISVSCSEIPAVPELEFSDNCSGIQDVVYNETSTIISIYAYVIVREWIVSDNCGNEASFTQTINVSVEEPFDAIPFAICIEDDPIDLFTILDDSIPTTGEWHEVTNSGGLTGSIFDPTNVTLGFYTLQYVVELGDNTCPMIYEVYLNVNDDCVVLAACDITVYNAVSPNDDGSNDFFFIDGLECYPDNTVEIYNRWGILVYDERGYDNNLKSFKGISEGRSTVNKNELLPDGTYFYILKYTDEENKKHDRSGYLYLNR